MIDETKLCLVDDLESAYSSYLFVFILATFVRSKRPLLQGSIVNLEENIDLEWLFIVQLSKKHSNHMTRCVWYSCRLFEFCTNQRIAQQAEVRRRISN